MAAPSHRIVTGPIAALEEALADQVFSLKAEDPLRPVVILVGETLLRPYLRRRLAELRGPHMNVHVLTVSEFGLRLGEHAMVAAGRLPLPILADRVLAHEAALSGDARYFDAVRNTPGFANALHRTLVDVYRGDFTAEHLADAGLELAERDKIVALAALAARHDELRAGHYDADQALAGADPTRLGADELIVFGLWDAPEILRRAIAAIGRSRPVTAYLPSAHPVADNAHAELREWMATEMGAAHEELSPPGSAAGSLAHVQGHLGVRGAAATATPDDDTVRIVSAPDASREVRAALRACLAWSRKGIPFHEMAIAYRHADPYRALIASIAREAGLPLYDHEGTPLAELPVGRRALALLDLLEQGLDRASVTAFATDNRPPAETAKRYAGSSAQWDRLSREAGVVRGIEQWRERLDGLGARWKERFPEDDEESPRPEWVGERLAQIAGLKAYVEDLNAAIARRPADAPWSEHVAHLEETFATYLRDQDPIIDAVRALTRLDGLTKTVSGDRFIAVVRSVIAGLRDHDTEDGRAGAFRARGINVTDASSLRHLRFRAVCVLGLAERSFPPAPRQDPLLLDDEREAIGLPLRARGVDPEPLQFALAVQAAGDRLLLSHPRTEHGSGRPLIASSFLRAAAEALAGERIAAESLPDRTDPWLQRLGADRVGAPGLADALDSADYDRTLLEVEPVVGTGLLARARPNAARGRSAWLARMSDGLLTPFEGGLTEAVRAELAGHPRIVRPMSPSSLETFADCPMRFFLSRILELGELDEPEDIPQISALERGSLMHAVFERAMREWLPGDPPSAERRSAHLARLREIADEECDRVHDRGVTGYSALWAADREAILMDLRLWYDAEVADSSAGFDSADFEVGFGLPAQDDDSPHTNFDPLELAIGDGPLRFHGRIDRLEWRADGGAFRVIDYKTGRNREKKSAVFAGGKALQLPLYLHAAADLILGRDWRDGEAQYFFSTRRGNFSRIVTTGAELDEHREDFERILGGFSGAISEGSFPARPEEWKCKWCDFRSLCPAVSDHVAQMERKYEDPRVIALDELEAIE